jgi:HEAT repeat protein
MNESAPEDKGKEVEAFIDALKDKNKEVRKFAAGSLDKIGDK